MSRSYTERQHLTERYQARQIKRKGPFKDYERRPEQTFLWLLMGYEQFPRCDWNGPNDYPNPEQLGHWRKHSAYSCSCRMCRRYRMTETQDANESKYKQKKYKQDQDYQEGLVEYYSDDKYWYE